MAGNTEDARLLVDLLNLEVTSGARDAMRALGRETFDAASAPLNDPEANKVLYFFEAVGTLVKRGMFDKELAHDMWWVDGAWRMLQPFVTRMREDAGEKRLYENFEYLVSVSPFA